MQKWMTAVTTLAAAALCAAAPCAAQSLTLDADAQREVVQDHGRLLLFVERQSLRPQAAANEVNTALETARTAAKQHAAFTVKSGAYTTQPQYDSHDKLTGYRVRGELVVESGDLSALSIFSGDVQPGMQVGGLDFSVSETLGAKVRAELVEEAAGAFAAKARAATRAFGFSGYTVDELTLLDEMGGVMPRYYGAGMAMEMSAKSAVPMEAGTERIVVRVHGKVALVK